MVNIGIFYVIDFIWTKYFPNKTTVTMYTRVASTAHNMKLYIEHEQDVANVCF